MRRPTIRILLIPLILGSVCLFSAGRGGADELSLKNGMVLQGKAYRVQGLNTSTAQQNQQGPIPNSSTWMIDDGVRRYFVFRMLVADHLHDDQLARNVTFKLKQEKSARAPGPAVVGGFHSVEPWDQFGRRTITLGTRRGPEPVIQAIAELGPDVSSIQSLKHDWDYKVDTKTLPPELIQSLIEQSSDRSDPAERKAAVQFYLQAEMFAQAQSELKRLAGDFPEYEDWCEEFRQRIVEANARRGLHEIQRRRDAGQHLLAYTIARKFPEERVSADVFREAADIAREYEEAINDRERAIIQLDMLQAELPMKQAERLRPMRLTLIEELNYETLGRLEPFLRVEGDDSLKAGEKLALAYSGWVVGSAQATLDLNEAVRLWDARFLVLEYLRTDRDPLRDTEILSQLEATEGAGVRRLAQMIPLLPLPFEADETTPSVPFDVDVPTGPEEPAVRYTVMLPPEYSPHHRYPLLVVLRGEGRSFRDELHWWGGDLKRPGWAQRRGYIVLAPHYCEEDATEYNHGSAAHEIVMKSIEHLRKRYRVDSDRIILGGHGMGGDACFDIGMAQPGEFAGAVPICGIIDRFAVFHWKNSPHLSWYVVNGERDRNSLDQNAATLNNMMKRNHDVLYCDYKSRGFEAYSEEQERIFDWMQNVRRASLQEAMEFEAGTLRSSDNNFYWMHARVLPERLFQPIAWDQPQKKIPRRFKGKITPGGTIYVDHPGQRTTIRLNPEIFDFDNRCRVRMNLRVVFNDFISPSVETLLSDLRERGDRERLFWAQLDL